MLGIAWLTTGFLLTFIGVVYILDYLGILKQIPILNMLSGRVQKHWIPLGLSIVLVLSGTGVITVGEIREALPAVPTAAVGDLYGADVVLIVAGTSGAAFADAGYPMYLLDYTIYSGSNENEILQEIIDSGTGGLVSPDGTTATPVSVSGGKFTWDDQTARVGDQFVIFGYDDSTPASGDYETFMTVITINGYNSDLGTFQVSPNRYQLYTFGAVDSYNFANTDVTGYQEDEDAAKSGMTIDFDLYSNADNNISKDMGIYIELPSAMQSSINKITVSTDTGIFAEYSSFLDTSNMDTSNVIFESAPSKQTAGNNLYYIGMVPDALRTSSTAKEEINVEVDYDHLGTGSNLCYVYAVQLINGGSDIHFDIAANPAFMLNATADGTDGWTT
jgi:hypothetical protein